MAVEAVAPRGHVPRWANVAAEAESGLDAEGFLARTARPNFEADVAVLTTDSPKSVANESVQTVLVLNPFEGSWFYGAGGSRIDINELESGQLLFEDRHLSGARSSGIMRSDGEWLTADLSLETGQSYGKARVRLHDDGASLVTNFIRGGGAAKWGRDVVAYKGPLSPSEHGSWALPTLAEHENEVGFGFGFGATCETPTRKDLLACLSSCERDMDDLRRSHSAVVAELAETVRERETMRLCWEQAAKQLRESEIERLALRRNLDVSARRTKDLQAELDLANAWREELEAERDLVIASVGSTMASSSAGFSNSFDLTTSR